jgi:hypothetical protein
MLEKQIGIEPSATEKFLPPFPGNGLNINLVGI